MGAPMVCVQGGEPPLCVCARERQSPGLCRVCVQESVSAMGGTSPEPHVCVCAKPPARRAWGRRDPQRAKRVPVSLWDGGGGGVDLGPALPTLLGDVGPPRPHLCGGPLPSPGGISGPTPTSGWPQSRAAAHVRVLRGRSAANRALLGGSGRRQPPEGGGGGGEGGTGGTRPPLPLLPPLPPHGRATLPAA